MNYRAKGGLVFGAIAALALGLNAVAQRKASMSGKHLAAKLLVDSLGLTPNESLYTRLVAWHETNYGQGWRPNFGFGSNNMGAITTLHPDQYSFKHVDSKYDDTLAKVVEYTAWFAGWPTPYDGYMGLAKQLLKPNVKEALLRGDFRGAVAAQYANGYFMGIHSHKTDVGNDANIADYYSALSDALHSISAETGESFATVDPSNPGA